MKEKILTILQSVRPEFDFEAKVDFISEGLLDSFDIVALVTSLDNEFNISIDGLDITPDNFSNIEGIVTLLKKNGVTE